MPTNANVLPRDIRIEEAAKIQDPPTKEAVLRELALAEELVNTFAVRAKRYWREWGALGEPMIVAIDTWAEAQLVYLQWLREGVRATYWPGSYRE
jgi:hypothetical protein